MKPRYDFGQQVRVVRNVRNDGTFPGREVGELLLRRGATGYVRDVGTFLQDEIIYSVDFIDYGYRVGCREPELVDADLPWVPNRYEFRDKVTLRVALAVQGEQVAAAGSEVEILKVERELAPAICLSVHRTAPRKRAQLWVLKNAVWTAHFMIPLSLRPNVAAAT